MRDAASSITLEEIKEKHKVPSSHSYSSKNNVEKNITIGKLEGSVEVHNILDVIAEMGVICSYFIF